MSTEEKRLVKSMHLDKEMTPSAIASATGRHICSVCRLLAQRHEPAPVGRPAALTTQQIDRLERILNDMIDKADAQEEVTVSMLMKRSKCKAPLLCLRAPVAIARALHDERMSSCISA